MHPSDVDPRVFVLCPNFHGATLMAILLNTHPAIVHLGDTNPTNLFDQPCSCGETVSTCDFWTALRNELGPRVDSLGPKWLPEVPPFTSHPRVNVALTYGCAVASRLSHRTLDRKISRRVRRYRDTYDRFTKFAKLATGARIFVDGEKLVDKAVLLASGDKQPTRVLHLTRDPRGFVFSNLRRGRGDATEWARKWRNYHMRVRVASRIIGRSNVLTLRYEDLALDTDSAMRVVFDFLGVNQVDSGASAQAGTSHVIGNRMITTWEGSIALDERWRTSLPAEDQAAILRESGRFAEELGYR